MKTVKIIAWIALIVFVIIQFIPTDKNESDTTPKTDFMMVNKVPSKIESQLKVSCYDCHSNNTAYPWYSKIQPIAWFLEEHIKDGKAELNFNEWNEYSHRRKKSKLRSIVKQIESGEMPMESYTLIHRDAILSKDKNDAVIEFMAKLKDSLK
ncbi:heme-binding domain-containing protein [Cellulophaga baltica]|uniref:heme-binding domain-containing protein n=1 Tax=Cellulophaga baltica TaxID=76594 RepID=UPI0024942506|nr:heme-binding domain-containing protein [Cellulophaga baltica]